MAEGQLLFCTLVTIVLYIAISPATWIFLVVVPVISQIASIGTRVETRSGHPGQMAHNL